MNPRITQAEYISTYKLLLHFKNDEVKIFDFSNYLGYSVYMPLRDEALCKKVKVFNGTVCWNDEIDFDPDTLYLESVPANINA